MGPEGLRRDAPRPLQAPNDDDPFVNVAKRGEAFLGERPSSAVEDEVRTEVARAYETWWSLSKAGEEWYDAADLARWKRGAERARRRAIELYRLVSPRDAHQKIRLQQVLFRLERDLDTSQRAYAPSVC